MFLSPDSPCMVYSVYKPVCFYHQTAHVWCTLSINQYVSITRHPMYGIVWPHLFYVGIALPRIIGSRAIIEWWTQRGVLVARRNKSATSSFVMKECTYLVKERRARPQWWWLKIHRELINANNIKYWRLNAFVYLSATAVEALYSSR